MAGTIVSDLEEITFKAPLPGHFVGQFLPASNTIAESPTRTPITTSPSTPASRIESLPYEIKLQIVSLLDVCVVNDLRLVCSSLRELVDAHLDFQLVQALPKLMRAVCHLGCRYYTLATLAAAVRDNRCSCCQNYGDYLYLLTAERLCYHCFREQPDYVPKAIKAPSPSLLAALESKAPLATVPPGAYGLFGKARLERPQLVIDRWALAHLSAQERQQLGGDNDSLGDSEPETERQGYLSQTSLNHSSPWATALLPARYTVVLPAPYWEQETQTFHAGVFCRACAMSAETQSHPPRCLPRSLFWDYPYRRYTEKEGMRRHMEECGPVRKVVTADGTGAKYVHDSAPGKAFVRPDELCRSAAPSNGFRDN
ncbi:Uu.00g037460.m01.CDS01 [Anthostomella pinea]|uniref:Uu.00g037460.m01.CDS01 n=1 Tax=Anthostomella pinea TaxID=933095 RepID=A0AAI8V9R1_9PEZI|nr:Uu.00g037460.m01.CDS01 [Anthostomella pinea]